MGYPPVAVLVYYSVRFGRVIVRYGVIACEIWLPYKDY
jgi:hypothetical protein